jgi:pSer/pThr/pTyr-binding forkhead associated (FHA) protein
MLKIEVHHLDNGQKNVFRLKNTKFVIGRSSKSDVVIAREEVSRYHIEAEWVNDQLFITDLHSTNGVYVHGDKIPSGSRTPHQTVFPLEIAGKISISIVPDEHTGIFNKTRSTSIQEPKNNLNENPVELEVEQVKLKPKNLRSRINNPKENTTKPQLMIFLVLAVFIGFSIFYFSLKRSKSTNQEISTSVQPTEVFSTLDPFDYDFKLYFSQNQCGSYSSLCEKLKLNPETGALVMRDNKIFVFSNLVLKNSGKFDPGFTGLSEAEKNQIFLSEIGTHPSLIAEAIQSSATNLVVIGYTPFENSVLFKSFLQVNFKYLSTLSPETHNMLFNEAYLAGILRPLRKTLDAHLKYSEL